MVQVVTAYAVFIHGDVMKYAVIENDKVINVVVSDPDFAQMQQWIATSDRVEVGWDYIDGQFIDNRPVIEPQAVIAPTKEQLLAQLQALQAQIEALE